MGFQEESVLPVPCLGEDLEDIEAWKLHKDEEAEEVAKCEEYGGQVDLEIAAKVRKGMAQGRSQGLSI